MATETRTASGADEILEAFAELRKAILSKNESRLWELHDPEFKATELHGRLLTAQEHITAILEGSDLEMEFFGLSVMSLGDLAIAWGRQSLRGHLRPEDLGKAVSDDVALGIVFVLTAVWRRSGDTWRILTYHVSVPEGGGDQ